MKELIERALAGGLQELSGLELSGVIPIRQELLNEAILETLKEGIPEKKNAERPKVDVNALLPHVKEASVEADGGKLTLRFSIKIDGA